MKWPVVVVAVARVSEVCAVYVGSVCVVVGIRVRCGVCVTECVVGGLVWMDGWSDRVACRCCVCRLYVCWMCCLCCMGCCACCMLCVRCTGLAVLVRTSSG